MPTPANYHNQTMEHSHGDMNMPMPGHGGHEGHDMPAMCSMNVGRPCARPVSPMASDIIAWAASVLMADRRFLQMLFTWDTTNLCIVFESWHIRSIAGLLFSLLAVILIGMGYEALRAGTRRYEVVMRRRMDTIPSESHSSYIPVAQ